MEQLNDLKAIIHSKRANIYYLEKCRVMQKDGRVVYLTEEQQKKQYWNIPIANTTVILLGMGTSITQGAVRMLASAGVLIGFSGSGGTPLLVGNEVEWLSPQSEYRPTQYIQNWLAFWFDEEKRLAVAKFFQEKRLKFLDKVWSADKNLQNYGFYPDDPEILKATKNFRQRIERSKNVTELLSSEALMAKSLYKYAAHRISKEDFARDYSGDDAANKFLNHGNYLAYGLAASTLWVLGISHGFAVMHGKTRRGALVFDVADLIKDSLVLPFAFIGVKENLKEQEFRQMCLESFTRHSALDYLFDTVKKSTELFSEQ